MFTKEFIVDIFDLIVVGALTYLVPVLFGTVFIAIAIAWGIRLGGWWLINAIAKDHILNEWLKQTFNASKED